MTETEQATPGQAPERPLAAEVARFTTMLAETPELSGLVGHRDLADGLWLSTDPNSSAALSCTPTEAGFRLSLEGGDSARWVTLGCRLRPEALRGGRYLGLLVRGASDGFLSCRPCLRWFWPEGGFQDVFSSEYVISPGGGFERLAYMPIDPASAERNKGAELNLFFQGDRFSVEFRDIEPLLMT
ncbi:hypothetical protein [Thalassovita aquimarina]|uniref:NADH:ubiquinone oxidoreductase intermediate-associated protein 30 domain-containing protein n=1 Tax=Thalassovita aquimarina TaxID=2785917 RepID=A0ABS5HMB2_9RHOB|nr:hypothetical protein [Thalassovita aquimarina]MBR9650072.1 hypothetical protein [Thalassovita aquimarina]